MSENAVISLSFFFLILFIYASMSLRECPIQNAHSHHHFTLLHLKLFSANPKKEFHDYRFNLTLNSMFNQKKKKFHSITYIVVVVYFETHDFNIK